MKVLLVAVQSAADRNILTLALLDAGYTSAGQVDKATIFPQLATIVDSLPDTPAAIKAKADGSDQVLGGTNSKANQLRSHLEQAKKEKEAQAKLVASSIEAVRAIE